MTRPSQPLPGPSRRHRGARPGAVGSARRRLRDAAEPLATHPVWAARVNQAQAALGLDFLTGCALPADVLERAAG